VTAVLGVGRSQGAAIESQAPGNGYGFPTWGHGHLGWSGASAPCGLTGNWIV
jgi:hypothetical protein